MAKRAFSVSVQIAAYVMVEIEAESFEDALAQGREMISTSRGQLHTLRCAQLKTERNHSIQDTEAHLITVSDDANGMMYR